jgi:hypothetical protein
MMNGMNKALRLTPAFAGLTLFLASCGAGVAPDGSGSVRITGLQTEYKNQDSKSVACDNITQLNNSITTETNVAVTFNLAGSVNTLTVGLKGETTPEYDSNYRATVTGAELADLGGGSFKTVFKADSINSQYLPQSVRPLGIKVNPVKVTIKNVLTNEAQRASKYGPGGFYTDLVVNTTTGVSYSANSKNLYSVPLYSQCKVVSDSGVQL